MNSRSMNNGLMKNVQNLYIEGCTLNSNKHKIQAKFMQINGTRQVEKLVDISGPNKNI
jgi:hypothetical protein